ncbi:MAG: sn-glycerol-3-phosphate ABC transporter ATP-binding protein UgpC, partial [Deltaproteobacteria bacterium]|nr:sn-glycerol-3-phosphate ABC transporter ATP-binding protein UgpC [Deltaproteobacteria bacterium]
MANLQIRQLKKSFGPDEVIHGIDIDIKDQSFVALVGPSGCGKSTLLRMIAGLEDPSGGEIRLNDTVLNDVAPKDRDIAMVFQDYALYPHMTVEKNMGFALKMAKVPKTEIKRQVDAAAQTLNLTEFLDRFPRQLSGGQRQRVAMGRCIVRNPEVFLFDEPLSNLDAKLRVKMRTEIKTLHQRLKATSIYVTHDQMEAMTLADQIFVMRGGYIEQVGAPLELYDYPDNIFVAEFIGSPSINLLEGVLEKDGDQSVIVLPNGTKFPAGSAKIVQENHRVVLGIRPEHLQWTSKDKGVPVDVEVIEPTGNETFITGKVAGQTILISFRERYDVHPGDTIYIWPDLNKIL